MTVSADFIETAGTGGAVAMADPPEYGERRDRADAVMTRLAPPRTGPSGSPSPSPASPNGSPSPSSPAASPASAPPPSPGSPPPDSSASFPAPVKAVRTDDRFYRWLVGSAAQAIISLDRELLITSWNQAAVQIFGLSASEAIGSSVEKIVPAEAWPRMKRVLQRTLNDQVVTAFEDDRPGPYGGSMSLSVTLAPILDDSGACMGVSGLVRDITVRKRLQGELQKAEKLASLGQLAGGVAHHFNNLLCGMSTRIDFALESRDPRQMERALRVAADAGGRMAEIVGNLLIFARPHESQTEPVALHTVVGEFAALKKQKLLQSAIWLETSLRPTEPVALNRNHFERLLHNLMSNSAEALGGRPGQIRLRTWQEGDTAKLEFSDDGPGIEPAALNHVFEPFFTTKGAYVGGVGNHAGLGLAVVHAVVSETGGKIEVDSRPGRGATFTINLPVHRPGEAPGNGHGTSGTAAPTAFGGLDALDDPGTQLGPAIPGLAGPSGSPNPCGDPRPDRARPTG
jgi:PAS domain S-box-containing protein